MSRREFLKRVIVGVVASLALFVAGCGEGGGGGGGEQENGGENNGGEEEDGGGGY